MVNLEKSRMLNALEAFFTIGIGQDPIDGRHGAGFRTGQINVSAGGTAARVKVAVK